MEQAPSAPKPDIKHPALKRAIACSVGGLLLLSGCGVGYELLSHQSNSDNPNATAPNNPGPSDKLDVSALPQSVQHYKPNVNEAVNARFTVPTITVNGKKYSVYYDKVVAANMYTDLSLVDAGNRGYDNSGEDGTGTFALPEAEHKSDLKAINKARTDMGLRPLEDNNSDQEEMDIGAYEIRKVIGAQLVAQKSTKTLQDSPVNEAAGKDLMPYEVKTYQNFIAGIYAPLAKAVENPGVSQVSLKQFNDIVLSAAQISQLKAWNMLTGDQRTTLKKGGSDVKDGEIKLTMHQFSKLTPDQWYTLQIKSATNSTGLPARSTADLIKLFYNYPGSTYLNALQAQAHRADESLGLTG